MEQKSIFSALAESVRQFANRSRLLLSLASLIGFLSCGCLILLLQSSHSHGILAFFVELSSAMFLGVVLYLVGMATIVAIAALVFRSAGAALTAAVLFYVSICVVPGLWLKLALLIAAVLATLAFVGINRSTHEGNAP